MYKKKPDIIKKMVQDIQRSEYYKEKIEPQLKDITESDLELDV